MTIDAILMAAGSSRRFGSDKRCFPVQGTPMLQRSLEALLPTVRRVWVVLREEDADALAQLLGDYQQHPQMRPLFLSQADLGMGSNLARAVAGLPEDCEGVLVALADMPFIRVETIRQLVAAFAADRVVFPVYRSERGHPVLFPACWFSVLSQLDGDRGARKVLEQAGAQVLAIDVDDPGVLEDLDHPPW